MTFLRLRQAATWTLVLTSLLAAFFLFGAVGNLIAPPPILEDYRRWGYPDGFNLVTGALELLAAALIVVRRARLAGLGLGALLMAAATLTVVAHREYAHAVAPLVVLAFTGLAGWLTLRSGGRAVEERG